MFCKNCGSEIDDQAVICPHCGVPVQNTANAGNQLQAQNQGNPMAIVGFVFSFLIAIVGLICSIMGYNKAKNEGLPYKGLALAGIIISAVSMGLYVLIYIIAGAALAAVV